MKAQELSKKLTQIFSAKLKSNTVNVGEVTIEVAAQDYYDVCLKLKNDSTLGFDQLMDLCGVDYSEYGQAEWVTEKSTTTGFSRGVETASHGYLRFGDDTVDKNSQRSRYAVVCHFLSIKNNHRVRVRVFTDDEAMPVVSSIADIWNVGDWFEREAFDLFGIHFEGHPDLRRILTDYGFVGHPLRKDFPLSGNVEMRFDPEQKRVIYEPVSIEPRVLVPRVIRNDHRYYKPEETANDA